MVRVTIIGPGRIGGALALSLPREKYSIESLIVRGTPDIAEIASNIQPSPLIGALVDQQTISSEIVFITTQDASIIEAAEALSHSIAPGSTVYHTSGALASTVLESLKKTGCKTGSIHPLVSISRPGLGPERFKGAYFCIEGDAAAVETAMGIVADLGGRAFAIDTRFKTLYHAAAVTASGHLVALFDASIEMMVKCGLSAQQSKDILMPLVQSTVDNLSEQSTSAALTGTFARADIDTFTRHMTALNANVSDELLEIYLILAERSLELAAREGVSPDRVETLRTKVAIAKSKLKW